MTTGPTRFVKFGRTLLIFPAIIGGLTAPETIGGRVAPLDATLPTELFGTSGPFTATAGSIANLDDALFIADGPDLLILGAGVRSLAVIELGLRIGLGDVTGDNLAAR